MAHGEICRLYRLPLESNGGSKGKRGASKLFVVSKLGVASKKASDDIFSLFEKYRWLAGAIWLFGAGGGLRDALLL